MTQLAPSPSLLSNFALSTRYAKARIALLIVLLAMLACLQAWFVAQAEGLLLSKTVVVAVAFWLIAIVVAKLCYRMIVAYVINSNLFFFYLLYLAVLVWTMLYADYYIAKLLVGNNSVYADKLDLLLPLATNGNIVIALLYFVCFVCMCIWCKQASRLQNSNELAYYLQQIANNQPQAQLSFSFLTNLRDLAQVQKLKHNQPTEAQQTLGHLQQLVYYQLRNKNREQVALGEEVDFVLNYIATNNIVSGSQFSLAFDGNFKSYAVYPFIVSALTILLSQEEESTFISLGLQMEANRFVAHYTLDEHYVVDKNKFQIISHQLQHYYPHKHTFTMSGNQIMLSLEPTAM